MLSPRADDENRKDQLAKRKKSPHLFGRAGGAYQRPAETKGGGSAKTKELNAKISELDAQLVEANARVDTLASYIESMVEKLPEEKDREQALEFLVNVMPG